MGAGRQRFGRAGKGRDREGTHTADGGAGMVYTRQLRERFHSASSLQLTRPAFPRNARNSEMGLCRLLSSFVALPAGSMLEGCLLKPTRLVALPDTLPSAPPATMREAHELRSFHFAAGVVKYERAPPGVTFSR